MEGKLIIFSAPSGSGKTTIINSLMSHEELNLSFSISCTSRTPRGNEHDGVEYHFVTPEEFRSLIEKNEFLEYEEVYKDRYYGTLKSHVDEKLKKKENVIFDVDVKGGCAIKEHYGKKALAVFVQPPSIEELRLRLEKRATDSSEVIAERLSKASYELSFAPKFDHIIVNDVLERAEEEALQIVRDFLFKD